MGEIWWIT